MAKSPTPPANPGWPVHRVAIEADKSVTLRLAPRPPSEASGVALLRAEADRAVDELKKTDSAVALLRQRSLLHGTREQLTMAYGAVATARADSAAALAQGDGAAAMKAEGALREALADVDVIATRLGNLLTAIGQREAECAALWEVARRAMYTRLHADVAARLDAARAALSGSLQAQLVSDLVVAGEMNVTLHGDGNMSSFCPAYPLGKTPQPAPPAAATDPRTMPSVETRPAIPDPPRCPVCLNVGHASYNGLTRTATLLCEQHGAFNPPDSHELSGKVEKVTAPQRPLEPADV